MAIKLSNTVKFGAAAAVVLGLGTCVIMNMGDEAPQQPETASGEPGIDLNQRFFLTTQPTNVYENPTEGARVVALLPAGACANLVGKKDEFTTTNILSNDGVAIPGYSDISHYRNTDEPISDHNDCRATLTAQGQNGLRLSESFYVIGNRANLVPLYRDQDLESPVIALMTTGACMQATGRGPIRQVKISTADGEMTGFINFSGEAYGTFRHNTRMTEAECRGTLSAPAPETP